MWTHHCMLLQKLCLTISTRARRGLELRRTAARPQEIGRRRDSSHACLVFRIPSFAAARAAAHEATSEASTGRERASATSLWRVPRDAQPRPESTRQHLVRRPGHGTASATCWALPLALFPLASRPRAYHSRLSGAGNMALRLCDRRASPGHESGVSHRILQETKPSGDVLPRSVTSVLLSFQRALTANEESV